MSKSYDNYIGITDTPSDIYGRTLSIPDSLITRYFEFGTEISISELDSIKTDFDNGTSNPRNLKRQLARELVTLYHNKELALQAEQNFDALFINKEIPNEMLEVRLTETTKLIHVMKSNNMASSNGEARRLIQQGGVQIDGKKITDIHYEISDNVECVLKVGKRKFLRIMK
jgi:tyrosyl-tRNA synthetase